MTSAAQTASSCSHILMTCQPAASSISFVSRSRSTVRASFAFQKDPLRVGNVRCSGQECQKHPSTNTAIRSRGKTMSAVRRSDLIGRRLTKYRKPMAWSWWRSRSSGPVSRPLLDRIVLRLLGVEAHDPEEFHGYPDPIPSSAFPGCNAPYPSTANNTASHHGTASALFRRLCVLCEGICHALLEQTEGQ